MPEVKIKEDKEGEDFEITVLHLEGGIDAYNSELLSSKLLELIEQGSKKIIIDCTNLNFISSSGMGVFLAVEDDINSGEGGLKFASLSETILGVFNRVGLTDLFKIYPDVKMAVDDFKKGV